MKLDDLIDYLALSDLGSSKLFSDTPKNPDAVYEISSRNRKRLLNHINEATMQVCQRLPVFWYTTVLRLVAGKSTYELNSSHSIRNMPDTMEIPDEPLAIGQEASEYYLYDSEIEPFQNNILLISKITSESGLYNLTVGDDTHKNSVMTPRPNVIELPEDMYENDEFVTVHYLGYTPSIPLDTAEGSDYEVDFPDTLKEAISTFIMYKLQVQPSDNNNAAVSISHLERFNSICNEYMMRNIGNISSDNNGTQFSKKGWR